MKTPATALLALLALSCTQGACTVQPWVKPYERALLADPIMSFDRQPTLSQQRNHVHEVTEGAKGATGSTGGGCGCN